MIANLSNSVELLKWQYRAKPRFEEGVETGWQTSDMDEGTVQTTNVNGSESYSGKASNGRTHQKVFGVPGRWPKTPIGGLTGSLSTVGLQNPTKKIVLISVNPNLFIQDGNTEGSLKKILKGL